ncbi:MAG: AMP-binding protein [Patescibacteria group bacterium]
MNEECRCFQEENLVPLPLGLWRSINSNPQRTAIDFCGRAFSYEDLGLWAATFKKIFAGLGGLGTPGDEIPRISLLLPNVPQFIFAYFGALLNRQIVSPVNYVPLASQLKTAKPKNIKIDEKLIKQFEQTRLSIVVVAEPFWPILEKVGLELFRDSVIIITSPADFLPKTKSVLYPLSALWNYGFVRIPKRGNVVRLRDLLQNDWRPSFGVFEEYAASPAALEDVSHLQYTGGTTGAPKGAMLTHENLVSNLWRCREYLGEIVEDGASMLAALPLCHSYGFTMAMTTLIGLKGKLVLLPKFSPKEACKLIEKHKIKLFPGSGKMFEAIRPLVGHYDLSSLTFCPTGAEKTPTELISSLRKQGVPVYEGYGQSETSPVISFCKPGADKIGSVGKPIPGTEIRIVDVESGEEKPAGEMGEIIVRGPQVMKGYYGNQKESAAKIKNGWLYTGDVGKIDEDGFLWFIDREDNSGKVAGEWVYGAPVREFLLKYWDIKNCVVFCVLDEKTGQSPAHAFILPGASFTKEGLAAHLRDLPNPYWRPKKVVIFDEPAFNQWFDPVLNKVNFKAAKKYYLENRDTLRSIYP